MLVGGENDREDGEKIKAHFEGNVYNACGKYDIHQSASIIRQAKSIITHDTGMMHIAAAFNKNIVSVWGNTVPAFGMTPYMREGSKEKSYLIQVEGLRCRPCSKLGHQQCPKKHFYCMELIDEEKIVEKIGWNESKN